MSYHKIIKLQVEIHPNNRIPQIPSLVNGINKIKKNLTVKLIRIQQAQIIILNHKIK